jgi:hypothetical protein
VGQRMVLLRWQPKSGVMNYRVQISKREDFSQLLLDAPATTDNPSYAPWLSAFAYSSGGTFYWRVAAADDIATNMGDFTGTRSFTLPPFGSSTKSASNTTLVVQKSSSRVRATGTVFPAHPGSQVTVRLYKKIGGSFRVVSTKRPTLSATSAYATRFSRPSSGTCKIRSIFPGDADHLASSGSVKFRC